MDVQKFRRKNVPGEGNRVEAVQLTEENVVDVAEWCNGVIVVEHDALDHSKTFPALNLRTALGMARVSENDFVLKDAAGDFHRRKPGIFQSKYELVEEEEEPTLKGETDDPFEGMRRAGDYFGDE